MLKPISLTLKNKNDVNANKVDQKKVSVISNKVKFALQKISNKMYHIKKF